MTLEEAETTLKRIRKMADDGDFESAHSLEDDFREAVLVAIVHEEENVLTLASIALRTSEISFSRWCG